MRILVALLLSLAAAAVAPGAEAPLKEPRLTITAGSGRPLSNGVVALDVRVENPNDAPVPYVGYTPESFGGSLPADTIAPLYRLEALRKGKWEPVTLGFCGTGRGPVSLAARARRHFEAAVPASEWDSIRVGLVCYAEAARAQPRVTWSPPMSRADVNRPARKP